MKVGIVSPLSPSDDAIGEYCANIAEELCKKTEVIVFANEVPSLPRLSTISNKGGSYKALRIWKSGLFYPFLIFRELIRLKPDVVHVQHEYFLYGKKVMAIHFPIILVLIRLVRMPLIVTMHHVIPLEKAGYLKDLLETKIPKVFIKAFLIIFNRSFSISSKIIVPSSDFKRTLSFDYKIDERKIEVLQHFVNSSKKKPGEEDKTNAKRILNLQNKKLVLFFGYIRPSKGLEYMILALPNIIKVFPNVLLSIVGKAQENYYTHFDYLRQLVEKNDLAHYVRFENHVSEELLPVFFTAADVVVFPYTETVGVTPIAHLRAASCGKPIVATNIDFFKKEFVDHENAILVPPRNPDKLSESVTEVLTNRDLSLRLSSNITKYCSLRSQDKASCKTIEIYLQSLKSRERN